MDAHLLKQFGRVKSFFKSLKSGLIFLTISIVGLNSYAEGTKEIMINNGFAGAYPNQFDSTKTGAGIQIWDTPWQANRKTGTYASISSGSDSVYRIKIRICNVGEVINLGFNQPDNDAYFRLYRPNGTTVQFPNTAASLTVASVAGNATGSLLFGGEQGAAGAPYTYRIPRNTEPGYINYFSQAYVGPLPATGKVNGVNATKNGFKPLQFIADMTGDYYICFNATSADAQVQAQRIFKMFDVTIWNNITAAHTIPTEGRLFCAAWDFQCGGAISASYVSSFDSELFFFSKDSVITAVKFNKMCPYGFIVTANSTGCANTGNNANDRKSRILFNGYPEYPVFLKSPLGTCGIVPKSSFGSLVKPPTVTGCDNDRCINLMLDKSAQVGITLFPPSGGPTFTPRIFNNQTVKANVNTCIPWDGLDGAGNKIVGPVTIQINYFNGLTNLPLYDVEDHPFGYDIRLISPTAAPGAKPIYVYWDDRPPAGDPVPDITAGTSLDGLVDFPAVGTAIPAAGPYPSHSSYNLFGCDPAIDNNASVAGKQGCHLWRGRGNNSNCATISPNCAETINTWWNANVIEVTVPYTPSNVEVYANTSHAPVPVGIAPYAGTSNDTSVCENVGTFKLNGKIRVETPGAGSGVFINGTGVWTKVRGAGTINSPNLPNATYTINSADIGTSVVLKLTSDSTALTPCGRANDTIRIFIKQGPKVTAGPNQTVCKNNNIVTLAGSKAGSTSTYQWFGGIGTFIPNRQTLNATYTPDPTEIAGVGTKTVTLRLKSLTTTAIGLPPGPNCPADSSLITISYVDAPVAATGGPYTICDASPAVTSVGLSGKIDGAGTIPAGYSVVWKNSAGVTFNNSSLTPTFTPTAAEITAGKAAISFTVTKTSSPSCGAVTILDTIIIQKKPTATVAASAFSVCSNNAVIKLNGVSKNNTAKSWTFGGCGGCTGNFNPVAADQDTVTFTPTSLPLPTSITFTFASSKLPTCLTDSKNVTVTFTAPPAIDAGPASQQYCKDNNQVQLAGTGTGEWWANKQGTVKPLGTFIGGDKIPNPIYVLTATELGSTLKLYYLSTINGNCNPSVDSIILSPVPLPVIHLADKSVCDNLTTVPLTGGPIIGSFDAASIVWTSLGGGSFGGTQNVQNATFTPDSNTISAGSVKLVLSIKNIGIPSCAPIKDTMILSFTPGPNVSAGGSNISACKNNPTVSLSGAASNFTTIGWSSSPAGTFSAPGSLNTTYTATNTTTNNTITLTASKTGCNSVSSSIVLSFTNPPASTISLISAASVCKNNPVITLQGTSGTGSGHWTSSSNCPSCFSDTNAVAPANVVYTPSATDLSNGSVSFIFTTRNNGNCIAVASSSTTVTFIASPTATPGTLSPVCENNATVNLSGSVTGASGGSWVSGSGCVSCFGGTQNSLNAVYNPSAADILAGNVTFKLTTTGNVSNCNSAQNSTSVTINKAPTADPGPDLVICSTSNTVALTGAATNFSSVTWSIKPGVGFGSFTSTNTLSTTYNISTTDKTNGTAILVLTANGNPGCASVPEEILLKFTNLPSVDAGTPKTVCLNDAPILLDGTGASGATWTCAGCTNAITNPNQLNATYSPGVGEGNPGAVSRTFTLSKPASGGCPAVTSSVLITINPAPIVTVSVPAMCANNTSTPVTATSSTGSGFWTRAGTGTFANSNILSTTYSPSQADTAAKSVVLTFESLNNGFCSAVKASATLVISPAVVVDAGPPQNICGTPGAIINLKGSIKGATFASWTKTSGGVGPFASPNTNPTTYTVQAGDAGTSITFQLASTNSPAPGVCLAQTSNVTYTIIAPPTVTIVTPPTSFCQSGSVTLTGNMTGGASTGSWACTNCAGIGTFSPNNSFNQSTQKSVQFTPNAVDLSKTFLTFQLTSFSPGLCPSVASGTVNINIDKPSKAFAGKDTLLCKNNAVYINTDATATNAGGGVFWKSSSCVYPAGPPCAAFTGGTNILNTTYTPTSTDLSNGFVTLTLYTIPAVGNACFPDSDKVVLTFKAAPKVNAGLDRSVCGNNRVVPVSGTVNAPYTGSWTTAGPPQGTAGFASTTAASTTYTITNADTTAGFVDLIFTSKNNTNCLPDDDSIRITITRPPKVNAGPDKTICADSLFVKLDASSSVSANPAGKWTTIGGIGNFVNNNNTSDTAIYIFNALDLTKPKISLIFTTPTGACLPIADTLDILITQPAKVTITTGDSSLICANQNTFNIAGTATPAGFGLKWTTAGLGSFTPANASPTVYNINSVDKSAGSVILTLKTVSPVGATCQKPVSKQFKLKIQPLNQANAGSPVTVCQDAASISLATATVTNATGGTWTTNGTGVFGPTPTTLGATAAYFPSSCCFATLDTAQASVTLTLTTTGNGVCPAATANKVITFTKLPIVNAGTDQNICADVNSVSLSGTTSRSTGSLWTRDPIAGAGAFTPTASNNLNVNYQLTTADKTAGLVKLALKANGIGACGSVTDTVLIKIRPIPTINLGGNGNICATSENVNYQIGGLTLTGATGVTWSSSSQGAAGFDLTDPLKPTYSPNLLDINNGQVTITASTTGAGTCNTVPAQMIVFITKAPTVDLGPPINSCVGLDVPVELNAVVTGAAGGTWSNNGANGAFDDPNSLTPIYTPGTDDDVNNTIKLTFTTVGVGSCTPVSKDIFITFSGTSDVNAGTDKDTCFVLPTIPNIPLKATGLGTWSGGSNTFLPSATTPNATYVPSVGELTDGNIIVLTYTKAPVSCSAIPSDAVNITYHQGNIVDAGTSQNLCSTAPTVSVTASLTLGSSTGFVWSVLSGSGNFGGSPTTTTNPAIYTPTSSDKSAGQVILKVTTTGSPLCAEATDTISIFFFQSPTSDAGSNQIICADQLNQANVVSLSGTVTGATSTQWVSPDGSMSFATPGSLNTTATVLAFPGNAQLQVLTGPNIPPCPVTPANVQINSTATPIVAVVDPAIPVCSNLDPIDLNQANPVIGGGTTTIMWSKISGTGSFTPNNTNLTGTFYQPSPADTAAGFVRLKLSATNTGICTNSYDTAVTFTFKKQPKVSAGLDTKICAQNNPVLLNGTANYAVPAPLTVQWHTTSTAVPPGVFTTSTTSLTTHYLPSAGDVANGGVILYLATTNGIPCPEDTDYVALQLTPEPAAIVDAGFNQTICYDNDQVQLSGLVINAAGGVWRLISGSSSGTISDSTDLHATYKLSAADKSSINNVIKIRLVSTGNGLCQPVTDTVEIRFTPIPVVTVAAPPLVCADTAFINVSGTVTIGVTPSTGTWSSSANSGIFSTSEFVNNAQYVPGSKDISNGAVTLTFTSNNNGTCNAYKKDTTITISPLIDVNAGANKIICANDTATGVKLIASSNTGSGIWQKISGDGKFTNVSGLTAIYIPGDTDVINGVASLRFISTLGTPCKTDTATILIDVAPAPSVTVGDSQTVCADVQSVNVNVTSLTIATGGFWVSSGSGTFANANALSTTYSFSDSDRDSSEIRLTFITTGNISNGSQCQPSGATTVITVNPKPVVIASAPSPCVTSTGILLSGSVTQVGNPLASGVWSSNSNPADKGIFSLDAFTLNARYFPSQSDINTGTVTLTLSSANAGTCLANGRSITLNVAPIPIADAGVDKFVCTGTKAQLEARFVSNIVSYDWTTLVGGIVEGSGLSINSNNNVTPPSTDYVLTVTDNKGCTNKDTVKVSTVTDPGISLTSMSCYDFYAYLHPIFTTTPVTPPAGAYQWYFNNRLMSGSTKDSVRVTQPGNYLMTYTVGGCTYASSNFETVIDLPRVLTPDFIGCAGTTVIATLIDIAPAIYTPYGYEWSLSSSIAPLYANTNPATLAVPVPVAPKIIDSTIYYVRVTDNSPIHCPYIDSVYVVSVPVPAPHLIADSLACVGQTITLDANVSPSFPPSNLPALASLNPFIQWFKAPDSTVTLSNTNLLTTDQTGNYVIKVTVGQCIGKDTALLDFKPLAPKVLSDKIQKCFEEGALVTLDAGVGSAGTAGLTSVSYQWLKDYQGDLSFAPIASQTGQTLLVKIDDFINNKNEKNNYAVVVTNNYINPVSGVALSCPVSDTTLVVDACAPKIFPANAFHPGDQNAYDASFNIPLKYINKDKFEIFIYSRWGEIIFHSNSPDITWNGEYRGDIMPVGVYAYTIIYEGKSEEFKGPFKKEGRIVLVR